MNDPKVNRVTVIWDDTLNRQHDCLASINGSNGLEFLLKELQLKTKNKLSFQTILLNENNR